MQHGTKSEHVRDIPYWYDKQLLHHYHILYRNCQSYTTNNIEPAVGIDSLLISFQQMYSADEFNITLSLSVPLLTPSPPFSLCFIPILVVSLWHRSELSFVLFSPLNGPSHFIELALWPSTQWKWHEKRLRSFVLWRSVIGPCKHSYPSDHIGFHDLQYGHVKADPLLFERVTNFVYVSLNFHR